jgi:hypothetical protein
MRRPNLCRSGLSLPLLLACLAICNIANAQSNAPPANKPTPNPPPKAPIAQQIPFPQARGGGPLHISVDGLSDGVSRVGAGTRLFGLCWAGGTPPYQLVLRDGGALPVLQRDGVTGTDLGENLQPLNLQTGNYGIELHDGIGGNSTGAFKVVPPSELPGNAGESDLAQASALSAQGPIFDYEAYLRLLGIAPGNGEAQQKLNDLCHRAGETAEAEEPVGRIFNTEIILADASLSSSQFGGTGFYYAYLTKQGTLLSEAAYLFETNSADTFQSGAKTSSSTTHVQQATTLLEYGVTDDLAVGAEISGFFDTFRSTTYTQNSSPQNGSANDSQWSDPTFLALYRVLDQDRDQEPATGFIRASYSPHAVRGGENVAGAGATIIREQDNYVFAGLLDTTYTGPSGTLVDQSNQSSTMLRSYWRYRATVQSQVQLDDRWFVGAAVGYQFAYNRDEISEGNPETVRIDGVPFVAASAAFVVVPNILTASLSYEHFFNTNYQVLQPGQATMFTRSPGADAVTLVLTSTVSLHDLHLGLW